MAVSLRSVQSTFGPGWLPDEARFASAVPGGLSFGAATLGTKSAGDATTTSPGDASGSTSTRSKAFSPSGSDAAVRTIRSGSVDGTRAASTSMAKTISRLRWNEKLTRKPDDCRRPK